METIQLAASLLYLLPSAHNNGDARKPAVSSVLKNLHETAICNTDWSTQALHISQCAVRVHCAEMLRFPSTGKLAVRNERSLPIFRPVASLVQSFHKCNTKF